MTISLDDIRQWLFGFLEQTLAIPRNAIRADRPFESYGLSSKGAMELVGSLEDWLDLSLDDIVVYEHPTVDSLSKHVVSLLEQ